MNTDEKENTYCALQIANVILKSALKKYHDIDVLKLNRLLFIAYGMGHRELNRAIFNDCIEAWKYGPIIPAVYHHFSHFHLKPVQATAFEYDFFNNKFKHYDISEKDTILKSFLIDIYKRYGNDSKFSLIHHVWSEDSPWAKSYKGKEFEVIDKKSIIEYFKNMDD